MIQSSSSIYIHTDDEHKDHHGDFVVDGCEQAQTVEEEDREFGSQIESAILVASSGCVQSRTGSDERVRCDEVRTNSLNSDV